MTTIEIFKLILLGLAGYLIGSANSSLIVGKFYGVDVRQHGSGNAGATNTLRTLGKKAALFATLGDLLKGVIAMLIGLAISGNNGVIVGGILAVIGHNWPIYFKFKGGKGILTSLAVVTMMDWKISLSLLGVFIIVVLITRYVSLGSVIGSALFPICAVFANKSSLFIIGAIIIGELAIIRHCSNLERIIKGNESKLWGKK